MNKIRTSILLSLVASISLFASPTKQELESHKKIVGYFPEWGVYSAHNNYAPSDTPFNKLTHVNYAFARIINGEVAIFDEWAATGITFNEAWDSPYKGTLGQFKKLKDTYPNTSFLISVGGWTQSAGFHDAAATAQAREKFSKSCVEFVRRWHFDGVDIDWEFPTYEREPDKTDNASDTGTPNADASEKQTFTLLLKSIREALTLAGEEDGRYYQLTAAVGSSKNMIEGTEPQNYAQYLDFINVMTYDMHGAWESKTNHQAPLFVNETISAAGENLSISDAVKILVDKGVAKNKIVIGSPFYSRGWSGVKNDGPIASLPGLGASATGAAKGIWDGGRAAGVNPYYHIKSQMENDSSFVKYRDPVSKMPYLFSASKGEMYTYDDEVSVGQKSDYVNDNALGGIIFWEVSADYPSKGSTLTNVIFNSFFAGVHPEYRNDDIDTTVPTETTTDTSTTTTTTTDTPSTDGSSNTTNSTIWSASQVYTKGMSVTYDNTIYVAKWWTQGDIPTSSSVWEQLLSSDTSQESTTVNEPVTQTTTDTNTTTQSEDNNTIDTPVVEIPEVNNDSTTDNTTQTVSNSVVWESSSIYTKGMEVSYDGKIYRAQWWTQGETPGTVQWGSWLLLSQSSDTSTIDNNGNSDSSSQTSEDNSEDNTTQDTADTSTPSNDEAVIVDASEISPWSADTIYLEGDKATYNAKVYESKWWSKGDTPVKSEWGVWKELGTSTQTIDTPSENENASEETSDDTSVVVAQIDVSKSMFAPFVDTTAWPPYDFVTNTQDSTNKNYALGFLVAKTTSTCEASWGTYYSLDNSELNMPKKIEEIHALGGRALVSFGGAANTPLAVSCTSVVSLKNEYKRVVQTLNLKEIDFDIEGFYSRDLDSIVRRSQAIKLLQDEIPELKIWFTLAVLPTGLTQAEGMKILKEAITAGVNISGVNIMAMDYGDFAAPNPNGKMGYYAIEAAKSLQAQLQTLYPNESDENLWKMVGITPMIGMNDVTTEIFDVAAAQEVLTFAKEKNIGLISLWSANRDKECSGGATSYVSISCSSLLQENNEFSKIFSKYGE